MLVGPTGGGKTKIFRCLRTALDKTTGITHKDSRFNPKAIRAQEMYGEVDPATGEWNTGKKRDFRSLLQYISNPTRALASPC